MKVKFEEEEDGRTDGRREDENEEVVRKEEGRWRDGKGGGKDGEGENNEVVALDSPKERNQVTTHSKDNKWLTF